IPATIVASVKTLCRTLNNPTPAGPRRMAKLFAVTAPPRITAAELVVSIVKEREIGKRSAFASTFSLLPVNGRCCKVESITQPLGGENHGSFCWMTRRGEIGGRPSQTPIVPSKKAPALRETQRPGHRTARPLKQT